MTPHNEHILLKYAQTRQADIWAETQGSPGWRAESARGSLAQSLAVRIGITVTLLSAALLIVTWLLV
jgi:hypothetical protein